MPEMAVYIAGGTCKDFIPYNLSLEEGFSRLFHGELTVLTKTKHTQEDLLSILDQRISLTISQTLGDGKTKRTRWLHGIVTGIKSSGLFGSGSDGGYSHGLTIEPALTRLQFTQATESFYLKTPGETIKAVLDKHGLDAQFPPEYFKRSYSKKLLFEQHGTPDLSFIQGISNLYGLAFTFQHKQASPNALGEDTLVFTEGDVFPVSDCTYSDKRKSSGVLHFDFLTSQEEQHLWKMEGWSMGDTIGVEGLELTTAYPNANYGSDKWRVGLTKPGNRYLNYSALFHGYQRDTPPQEIDGDIDLTLQAWYRARQLAKSRWTGEAPNLLLIPGCVFDLSHFYGQDDQGKITALVSGASLQCRTVWPQTLGIGPQGPDGGEVLTVKVQCMNYGSHEDKRFVSSR